MEQMNTRFLPGDKVTVLPYSEISAKFVRGCKLPSGCMFPKVMKDYCEKDYIVKAVRAYCEELGFYALCTSQGELVEWSFTDEMLEASVSPGTFVDGGILFDDIMNFGE